MHRLWRSDQDQAIRPEKRPAPLQLDMPGPPVAGIASASLLDLRNARPFTARRSTSRCRLRAYTGSLLAKPRGGTCPLLPDLPSQPSGLVWNVSAARFKIP